MYVTDFNSAEVAGYGETMYVENDFQTDCCRGNLIHYFTIQNLEVEISLHPSLLKQCLLLLATVGGAVNHLAGFSHDSASI